MEERYKSNREVIAVLAKNFDVFDCKGQVSRINNTIFRINIRPGAIVPKTTGIRLDKERLEFVHRWIKECVDKGYVERGPTVCAFPPVVVNKKGPAKFRACVNFQPLDEVLTVDPELELYRGDSAETIIM